METHAKTPYTDQIIEALHERVVVKHHYNSWRT
jgi:hypothetical protein